MQPPASSLQTFPSSVRPPLAVCAFLEGSLGLLPLIDERSDLNEVRHPICGVKCAKQLDFDESVGSVYLALYVYILYDGRLECAVFECADNKSTTPPAEGVLPYCVI